MPGLIFSFLEHSSHIKWFFKSQWDFLMGKFLYDPGGVALTSDFGTLFKKDNTAESTFI